MVSQLGYSQQDIVWTNFVNTSATGSTLTKISGTTGYDAGATSTSVLPAGQDGWVQFTRNSATGVFIGLADTNPNASLESINYCIHPTGSGVYVYEKGVYKNATSNATTSSSIIKIERVGTTIYYKVDDVIKYTSTTPSTTDLFVDISMTTINDPFANTKVLFDGSPPLPPDPPNPPSFQLAKVVSNTELDILWSDNSSNETGFEVERSFSSGSGFTSISTTGPNVTIFHDSGLTPATIYYYRIRAVNTGGNSAYTPETSATTLVYNTPTNFTVTAVAYNAINLNWTDNATGEAGYTVYRSTDGNNFVYQTQTSANATSYSDIGLQPTTLYYYRIRAVNGNDRSAYTPIVSATTLAYVALDPPTNLVATADSQSSINLTWTDNTANESGFQIERSTTSGSGYTLITTVGSNVTTFQDTNLQTSTTYYYRIRGVSGSDYSAYTSEASAGTYGVGIWIQKGPDIYYDEGNVGIGTSLIDSNPNNYKLAVNGKIGAKEVLIENTSSIWPDYVFAPQYNLPSLNEIEQFTKQNKHLPEIPSAAEIERSGQNLGRINALLLKKIEELTLHLIQLDKRIKELENE